MSVFRQRAAYEALAAVLAGHGLVLSIGVPQALQATPGAYLVSTVVEVTPSRLVSRLRPTLTLAVGLQDPDVAEWAIVDLVDLIAPSLLESLSDVCRASIETVTYAWTDIGGVVYRTADLSLILSQI